MLSYIIQRLFSSLFYLVHHLYRSHGADELDEILSIATFEERESFTPESLIGITDGFGRPVTGFDRAPFNHETYVNFALASWYQQNYQIEPDGQRVLWNVVDGTFSYP